MIYKCLFLLLQTFLIVGRGKVEWIGAVDWSPHDSLTASARGRMGPFAEMAI
jgi:hypothetical protein